MSEDWTDANVHDPGITLLEMLAYTVEALLVVAALAAWRSRWRAWRCTARH
ncbi:MAG: hypothetical protein ABI706_20930 [Ilumatobacteraceae bacterium]